MNQEERWIPTNEFARPLHVKPESVRHSYCVQGHYFGIKPKKLPNGRLAWPQSERDRLFDDQAQGAPGTEKVITGSHRAKLIDSLCEVKANLEAQITETFDPTLNQVLDELDSLLKKYASAVSGR